MISLNAIPVLLGLVLGIVTTESLASPSNQKAPALHQRMTKREIAKYFGASSHDEVPEYEVVSPFQADEAGKFIAHELYKPSRRKRSTAQPNSWFYNMDAFGFSLHLNVTKAKPILAPGSIVETTDENGSKSYTTPPKNTFYTGHVVSHPGSVVAISNQGGLTGMINLMKQALFIHPLPNHLAQDYGSTSGGQPHLIYRRSLDDVIGKGCDVPDFQERNKRSLETNRIKRSRDERSTSHKHLEVAMVADDLVVKRHGEVNLTEYLLMLAHVVDMMFHEDSVGEKKLTLVVVKIVIKKDGLGYDSSANNRERISKLTDWGEKNMPTSDKDPAHADMLILLTGFGPDGFYMRHEVRQNCNNDIGLASAIIIAHEAAHTFGLGHDGKGARCNNGEYIMSSAVSDGQNAFKWSPCSSKLIQDFLTGSGSSLQAAVWLTILPMSQENSQLRLLVLHQDSYECVSLSAPPIDGTRCGDRHWCIKGECVDDGSPMIDGGWSDWQDTQSCTRTCGGGVHWKTRTCTSPTPKNGGQKCEGSEKGLWKMCNTQPCPKGSTDYRLLQCKALDQDYTDTYWGSDPCTLICREGSKAEPRGRVKDGTRCNGNPRIKDVCIEGLCKPVGCDNKLDSGVMHDRCAVCGGDSSACSYVSGNYTKNWRKWGTGRPDEIISIPTGSTNIFAKMKNKNNNFLGVKNTEDEWVYSVGYTWSTVVKAAGTKVAYDHERNYWNDKVDIAGPTKEILKLMYVYNSGDNPGVEYHFQSPQKSEISPDQVEWKIGDWDVCSEDCAGGYRKRLVECVRIDDKSYVNDEICLKTEAKPPKEQACNTQPCPAEWYTSGWRPCSRTCGKGIQLRVIVCRQKISQDDHETLEDSSCPNPKPIGILQQECNKVACPAAEWRHLAWSACSRSCAVDGVGGKMTRTLKCMKLNSQGMLVSVSDLQCVHAVKPPTEEECNADITCPHAIQTPDGKRLIPLGCFKDKKTDRALPELVKNMRGKINWQDMEKTVKQCADSVTEKDSHLKVFSVQYYGECWTGGDGDKTYSEYGSSSNCWKGVGGSRTNFVYEFIDDDKNP
ncbi:metalloendopeptidase [Desmophyllum pertusum]|uniref:Metalloendopeptidase n=1 Tax=Desmophyllum pertusum TaxID=174260 RepID=A0A9W9Y9Y1_9CNID|nr:metalloendopeptidase [Desmophyllum pertusum]